MGNYTLHMVLKFRGLLHTFQGYDEVGHAAYLLPNVLPRQYLSSEHKSHSITLNYPHLGRITD